MSSPSISRAGGHTRDVVLLHGFSVVTEARVLARASSASAQIICVHSGLDSLDGEVHGPVVARAVESDGTVSMQTITTDEGLLIEWPNFMSAHATISSDSSHTPVEVRFAVAPGVAHELVGVMTSPAVGALAAFRGALVLHATTVVVNGMGVALLADRGGGKSSVAALLGSSGAALLAEDITAVRREADGLAMHSGVHEVRLRDTTPWLADLPGLTRSAPHVDGRIAVVPLTFDGSSAPAGAVVVVQLSPSASRVGFTALSPAQCVAVLMAAQRCPFIAPKFVGPTFSLAADLADQTRAGILTIPWAAERRNAALGAEIRDVLAGCVTRGGSSHA